MSQTYPRQLCLVDAATLHQLGLSRDNAGRLRTAAGTFVCEVSGREHSKRLFDIPDYKPDEDAWGTLWVDEQEAVRAGRRVVAGAGGFLGILSKLAGPVGEVLEVLKK